MPVIQRCRRSNALGKLSRPRGSEEAAGGSRRRARHANVFRKPGSRRCSSGPKPVQSLQYYNLGDRMKKWGTLGAFRAASGACSLGRRSSGSRALDRRSWSGAARRGRAVRRDRRRRPQRDRRRAARHRLRKDSALKYEREIKAGRSVVVAHARPRRRRRLTRSSRNATVRRSSTRQTRSPPQCGRHNWVGRRPGRRNEPKRPASIGRPTMKTLMYFRPRR
jgi:hypothetical protein